MTATSLFIFMSILGDFKGLTKQQSIPICHRLDDFLEVEKKHDEQLRQIWKACSKDKKCNKLQDDYDDYIEFCADL